MGDARELMEEDGGEGTASMDEILSDLQRQREEQRELNAELGELKSSVARQQAALEKKSAAFEASEESRRSTAQKPLSWRPSL